MVRDAAIGGMTSSFPYGWCLKNFLGWDVDAYSWDVGMQGKGRRTRSRGNKGSGQEGFEAFLRNGMMMERKPMLMVREDGGGVSRSSKGGESERINLLQK